MNKFDRVVRPTASGFILLPSTVRVGALLAAEDAESARAVAEAASKLALNLRSFPIARREEIAPTIAAADTEADALYIGPGPFFNT